MILKKERRDEFQQFLKTEVIKGEWKKYLIAGQTVFRSIGNEYFLSNDVSWEPRIFPYSYCNRFWKDEDFEKLRCAPEIAINSIPDTVFYELKFCDEDEFSHYNKPDLNGKYKNMVQIGKEWQTFLTLMESQTLENVIPLAPDFPEQQMPILEDLSQ